MQLSASHFRINKTDYRDIIIYQRIYYLVEATIKIVILVIYGDILAAIHQAVIIVEVIHN